MGVRALNDELVAFNEYVHGSATYFSGSFSGTYVFSEGRAPNWGNIKTEEDWDNITQVINLPGQRTRSIVDPDDFGKRQLVPSGNGDYYILITKLRPRVMLNDYYLGNQQLENDTKQIGFEVIDISIIEESEYQPIYLELERDMPAYLEFAPRRDFDAIACNLPGVTAMRSGLTLSQTEPQQSEPDRPRRVFTPGRQRRGDNNSVYNYQSLVPNVPPEKTNKGVLIDLLTPYEWYRKQVLSKRQFLEFSAIPPVIYATNDVDVAGGSENYFGVRIDIEGYYSPQLENLIPFFPLSP